ncbi:MAG: O-antigen ligase family protein [Anaerolineae bacterium]
MFESRGAERNLSRPPLKRLLLSFWLDRPLLISVALALVALLWGLLLARLPLVDGALVSVLAGILIGSLLEPLVGVGGALFFGPLGAWLRAEFPKIPPFIGQYIFAATLLIWIIRGLIRRELRIPAPPLLWPLFGFMTVLLLSLWEPADAWVSFMEWAKWAQILLLFLVTYDRLLAPGGERRVVVLVLILAAVVFFQAAVGIWQFGLRGEGPGHFAINERFYRAYGTFEQPNPFGGFLGFLGAFLTGIVLNAALEAWETRRLPHPWIWGVGCGLLVGIAAILASWSRGAWMGFGAASLVLIALLPRRAACGLLLVALLVGGGLGLYVTGLLPDQVADRLVGFLEYTRFEDVRGASINEANYAVLERMAHWQSALEMWRDNFWLGVGFGGYEPAYPDYRLLNWPMALGHAHNYYLNLLAETGILGLCAYLGFFALILVRLLKALPRLKGWPHGVALGLLGAYTHLLVHSLVDNLLVNNVHLHFGALLALSAWVMSQAHSRTLPSP